MENDSAPYISEPCIATKQEESIMLSAGKDPYVQASVNYFEMNPVLTVSTNKHRTTTTTRNEQ